MTNKYQKAKDYILRTLNDQYDGTLKLKVEALETLQELIDNYEKALRLCVMETREKAILEKALGKLDETLTNYKGAIDIENGTIWYTSDKETFGTWKEWALKESGKQEIKKCKWCGSEIKENHRGYCSELCREYGEEWEYKKNN